MNNAKLWLVVKPTVGIPLFLSAVAIGSFAVHLAVLSKTSWYEDFAGGQRLGTTAQAKLDAQTAAISLASANVQGEAVLIRMPDGTVARATLETPVASSAALRH